MFSWEEERETHPFNMPGHREAETVIMLPIPDGSVVKNPPAMQETQVQSLGWQDPLEKEMATWWTTARGIERAGHDLVTKLLTTAKPRSAWGSQNLDQAEGPFSEVSESAWPCQHLDCRRLASRTLRD